MASYCFVEPPVKWFLQVYDKQSELRQNSIDSLATYDFYSK